MLTARASARISVKNILVTTDFSDTSYSALPFALALARLYGARLVVAHVLGPEPRRQVVLDRVAEQDDRVWQDAKQRLLEFAQHPSLENTHCRTLLEFGDIADIVPSMIQEHAIDLVVLGTSGRRGVAKIFLGSGAEKIYRSATCPVLTVGPKARLKAAPKAYGESGTPWKIQHILFPVDLAGDSADALHYALSLAEENQASLVLLNAEAMVPWQHQSAVEARVRQGLEDLIPDDAKDWCEPQYVVSWEEPADAILHTAHAWAIDLIVMGVHTARIATLSSHLPWPIASEVVSRAPCPVLTVRV